MEPGKSGIRVGLEWITALETSNALCVPIPRNRELPHERLGSVWLEWCD